MDVSMSACPKMALTARALRVALAMMLPVEWRKVCAPNLEPLSPERMRILRVRIERALAVAGSLDVDFIWGFALKM